MNQRTKLRTLTLKVMESFFYAVMMMYCYVFVKLSYHVYHYYDFLMTCLVVMSMMMMMHSLYVSAYCCYVTLKIQLTPFIVNSGYSEPILPVPWGVHYDRSQLYSSFLECS